ncbi:Ham1-like protein [Acidimicrobiia bacterium]
MAIYCASANPHKVSEMAEILGPLGIELYPRPDHVPDVIEDADTLVGNARLKAVAIAQATGYPALADDTGLEVDALGGLPGVRSARYAGEGAVDADNVAKLLSELNVFDANSPEQRRARFRTVIVVHWPTGEELIAEGVVEGHIAMVPTGENGFGYDPVFVPDEAGGRTFAELTSVEKNAISHRGRALRSMAAMLKPGAIVAEPDMSALAEPVPVISWGMGDVFYALLFWICGGLLAGIVLISSGNSDSTSSSVTELGLGVLVVSLVSGWPGFLGWPIVASYTKGQRSLAKDFGLEIRPIDVSWGLLGGAVALLLSAFGSGAWAFFSGESAPTNTDFLPTRPSLLTALVIFFFVAICTPIVEELFFRGLFLRAVGRRWSLSVAVVTTSVVFGLFHSQGGSLGKMAFIVAVTASYGAVFALLDVRANGRLGPSIVAHMVVNTVGVFAALYA